MPNDSGHTADRVPGQDFTCASFHPLAGGDTSRFGAFNPRDFGNPGTENLDWSAASMLLTETHTTCAKRRQRHHKAATGSADFVLSCGS
jgi:hypothetical protein